MNSVGNKALMKNVLRGFALAMVTVVRSESPPSAACYDAAVSDPAHSSNANGGVLLLDHG
jgi:hypothetical protein